MADDVRRGLPALGTLASLLIVGCPFNDAGSVAPSVRLCSDVKLFKVGSSTAADMFAGRSTPVQLRIHPALFEVTIPKGSEAWNGSKYIPVVATSTRYYRISDFDNVECFAMEPL